MKKTTTSKKAAEPAKSLNTPKAVEAAAKKLKAAKTTKVDTKPAAPAPKKAAAPKPVAPKSAPAKVPAAKPAPAPAVTKVVAIIDVGFGNNLTIRGEGPGLSWDSGVVMVCSEGNAWVWSSAEATGPVTFKVLANDVAWCAGDDYVVHPGDELVISPAF